METERCSFRRGAAKALLAAAVLLFALGCSNQPEEDTYAVATGVNADVGTIQVRSLLIVSAAESVPGRLLGSLFNFSQEPVEVTITDQDDDVAITVEGGATHQLDSNPAILTSVSDIPGSRVPLTVKAGTDTAELQVPVLDGTLDQYPPYLPTASPSP